MSKLVRDKIPDIMKEKGKYPSIYQASDQEYWEKLKEKLREEVNEFLKSEEKEELADIMEVIEAIGNFKNVDKNELERIKKTKAKRKGSFKKRIILQE